MENAEEVSKADQSRRKELGDKFNATIDDVTAKLAEQAEARTAHMAENEDLRTKLGSLLEKFDQQEQANNARFAAKVSGWGAYCQASCCFLLLPVAPSVLLMSRRSTDT